MHVYIYTRLSVLFCILWLNIIQSNYNSIAELTLSPPILAPMLTPILIITTTSNHPEFIPMQEKSFKKYLQDPYIFVVFNDAPDDQTCAEIDTVCAAHQIPCVRVPQKNRPSGTMVSWASYRHGQAINYFMKALAFNYNGIVMLIDSDMFLIKQFSVTRYLEGYDIAGLGRGPRDNSTEYLWPGLLFFRMNTLPDKKAMDFMPEDILRFDTGGSLYHYFKKHPEVKILPFPYGRLKLDDQYIPFYFYSSPCRGHYLTCPPCAQKIENRKDRAINSINLLTNIARLRCRHIKKLFDNVEFREELAHLIITKQVPLHAEFILGDTFFHLSGGSGYYQRTELESAEREKRLHQFMQIMLR